MPVTLSEVAHSIFYAPQYAAIELGYFEEEGIDLTLVNGSGADKVMTALIAGEADIGFMGSEASIYTYAGGEKDYAVNFAQLPSGPAISLWAGRRSRTSSGKTWLGRKSSAAGPAAARITMCHPIRKKSWKRRPDARIFPVDKPPRIRYS